MIRIVYPATIAGLLLGLCLSALSRADEAPANSAVTFNKDIAPLVFEQCATCHRPGEVAPFSLLSYQDIKKRAAQIQEVTSKRFMPPWKSVDEHGQFLGERRLTDDQVQRITRWVEAGSPEGEAKDLPSLPKFSDGWKLGPPKNCRAEVFRWCESRSNQPGSWTRKK